jgi:hypothetical protein
MPTRTRSSARGPPDPDAVRERRTRALEEPLDVRLRSRRPYPKLEVRNPLHRTVYLVLLPEFPSRSSALCTCTDFARRGLGTCKHLEAAARWLGEHADATPLDPRSEHPRSMSRRWKRIDALLSTATREPGTDARRLRRPGSVLLEDEEN